MTGMLRRLISVVCLVFVPGLLVAQPADKRSVSVDTLFAPWNRPDAPGAAVAVIEAGNVVHMRGYGMANLEHGIPITPRTVFDIASVSKQFCAFAIAHLAIQGRLSLDDDIRKYLPEMATLEHTITIRHLVHHTSGLRDWPSTLAMGDWDMEDVISFAHILTFARNQETLNFTPGAEFSYSNTGYNLLAEIVQRVTGQYFRTWTEKHFFQPLGMVHSLMRDDHEQIVPGRAYGYAPAGDTFHRIGNGLTALGSSSLFTTLEDLVRWAQNFRHRRVGGDSVYAQMHERGRLADGSEISYAFGHGFGAYRGHTTIAHTGSWAGFRSVLMRVPEQDLVVIVLSNARNFRAQEMASRVVDIYLTSPAATPVTPVSSSVASTDDVSGLYRLHAAAFVTISVENDTLRWQATGEPAWPLIPIEDGSYLLEPSSVRVHVTRDAQGRVQSLTVRGQAAPRVEVTPMTDPASYEGEYYSYELDASLSGSASDDGLEVAQFRLGATPLTPVTGDTFTTSRWYMPVITFVRDARGRVTHLEASNVRSRHVHFEKRLFP